MCALAAKLSDGGRARRETSECTGLLIQRVTMGRHSHALPRNGTQFMTVLKDSTKTHKRVVLLKSPALPFLEVGWYPLVLQG